MKRLLGELYAIREVINIHEAKGRKKTERKQTVLTRSSELQDRLMLILGPVRERERV